MQAIALLDDTVEVTVEPSSNDFANLYVGDRRTQPSGNAFDLSAGGSRQGRLRNCGNRGTHPLHRITDRIRKLRIQQQKFGHRSGFRSAVYTLQYDFKSSATRQQPHPIECICLPGPRK